MPFWEAAVGAFIGGGITAAISLWWARRHRWPWPELEEADAERRALEHRVKMLQGRLNQIAPPREGTGQPELSDAAKAKLARSVSRADLLRDWNARKGEKGA